MNRLMPCLITIFLVGTTQARSLDQLAACLDSVPSFFATARYEVLMPTLDRPVCYDVRLNSKCAAADSLSPADYLIDWTLHAPLGDVRGFVAYYDGNHFRYRDKRLLEYHYDADPSPFMPDGLVKSGVQNNAQFVDLLPQFLARHFREILADSSYHYTVKSTVNSLSLSGVRLVDGYECQEYCYTFALPSLKPLSIALENNPGQLGEQTVTVNYSYDESSILVDGINYAALLSTYPDEFSLYRQSTYTLDLLPDKPLPQFNAKSLDGSRYCSTDKSSTPKVIAFLDSDVSTTAEVIASVRKACALMPFAVEIVWAYLSHHHEGISEQVGDHRHDEQTLISVRGLARDCGVVNTPVLLFCDGSNIIRHVINGFNNHLYSDVIEKLGVISKY